jgi:hypothetical protein
VSIHNPVRRVLRALSLSRNPMPPRTTRKSDRRKASDRTMVGTTQPVCLSASGTERRRYDSNMNLRKTDNHSVSSHYWGWTARPFPLRLTAVGEVFVLTSPFIERRFVDTMHRIRAEGFVCKNRHASYAGGRAGQHFKCKFVTTASFIVGPKPAKKVSDGHRSIAVYLFEEERQLFMGTVGVPERYPLPTEGQIVEIRFLYCHPGSAGKLIQAKYFGQIRDDIARGECSVSQLKLRADESEGEQKCARTRWSYTP